MIAMSSSKCLVSESNNHPVSRIPQVPPESQIYMNEKKQPIIMSPPPETQTFTLPGSPSKGAKGSTEGLPIGTALAEISALRQEMEYMRAHMNIVAPPPLYSDTDVNR